MGDKEMLNVVRKPRGIKDHQKATEIFLVTDGLQRDRGTGKYWRPTELNGTGSC